jgi:hypothetical protein
VKVLDKPVTYAEPKIPLGDLVAKVAADTGARLTAHSSTADEPVTVVVKEMPARRLLEELAGHLDYLWMRQGKAGEERFEIVQDVAGRQREERLRNDHLAAADQRFRESIQAHLEVAGWPAEKIQAALAAEQQRQKEPAALPLEQQLAREGTPERQAERRGLEAIHRLSSPLSRALMRVAGRLTPAQWATLRAGEPLMLSTEPKAGEQPLPPEIAQALRSAPLKQYPVGPILNGPPEAEAQLRQAQQEQQKRWAAATGYRIRVTPASRYFKVNGSQVLNLSVQPLGAGDSSFGGGDTLLSIAAGGHDGLQHLAEATPERRAALAKDPVLGVRKPFKPQRPPSPQLFGPNSSGTGWFLRDLLPDLARVYNVQFIADAYGDGPVVDPETLAMDREPALWELLHRYTGSGYHSDREGNLIRLRSRNWFLDRPRELPQRIVLRWKTQYEQRGALPLEELLHGATTLRDEQLLDLEFLGGKIGVPVLSSDLQPLSQSWSRQALRLYAALSAAQRQTLGEGKPLPVARLLPDQRRLFLSVLKEQNRLRVPALPLDQAEAGALTMTTERRIRVRAPGDPDRELLLEPDGPSASPTPATPASPAAPVRFPVQTISLEFQYAPDRAETVSIVAAAPA